MKISQSKLSSFLALATLTLLTIPISVACFIQFFPELSRDPNHILFLSYLSAYICMWSLYFASKAGPKIFQVSTLRRLLLLESKNWTNTDSEENSEIENLSMEKAKTSITATAMLVGVSFLGIIQAKTGLQALTTSCLSYMSEVCQWNEIVFLGLAFTSSLALVCFILSVDSLDCMFNEFKTDQIENKFRRYFYKTTIHPRYVGLVCLLSSIIFLNAATNTALGSTTIGVIIAIGYRHWFPRPELASDEWVEKSGVFGFWLRFIPLVCLPIAVAVLL